MLAIVLLRKESDGWRRGEQKESAGSECTWDLLLTGGEGRAVCEAQTVYGRTLGPTGVSLAGSHLSILIQNSLLRCLAFPDVEVSDGRSPPRNGGQEPFSYECPPVEGGHQAEGCEKGFLA